MTLEEAPQSWYRRIPRGLRIALVVTCVLTLLCCLAGGVTAALSGALTDDEPAQTLPVAAVSPAASATAEASASPGASPSAVPSASPSPSVKPSPKPVVKPSPKPKLVVKKVSVTAVNKDGRIVSTIKVAVTGYGSAKIDIIYFFAAGNDLDRSVTVTGTGGTATITKTNSVPNGCIPGYVGSVLVSLHDDPVKFQSSVDVC